jgi:hypothetical protein
MIYEQLLNLPCSSNSDLYKEITEAYLCRDQHTLFMRSPADDVIEDPPAISSELLTLS